MKNIVRNLLLVGTAAFMSVSCDLDLFPDSAIAYDEGGQLITNSADLTSFENGLMASYRGVFYGVYNQASELMCDGFNAMAGFGNNYGPIHRTDVSFTPSDYDTRDNWSGNYGAIKNYNVYIKGSYNVPAELAKDAAVARGEAFFCRASSYLTLTRLFAKPYGANASTDLSVPLVLVYDQNARPARNTVQEVYDQIKSDLDSAAIYLAGVPGAVRSQRPTIDAVNALYARYYLDTKQYAQAVTSAKKVIDSKAGYAFAKDSASMALEYVEDKGTEPIIQMYASNSENGSGTNSIYTQMANNKDAGTYYMPYYLPSQKLLDQYEESDLRYQHWFAKGDYPVFSVSDYIEDKLTVFRKYFGNPTLRSDPTATPNARQAVKPLLISEMYLIAAEASLANNNTAAAKEYLNAIQTARGASATEATTANIQNEWFKETVGEGLRMSCLKRWGTGYSGRPGQNAAVELKALMNGAEYAQKSMPATDYHWQWPIPAYEMQINPNLKQNDGYSAVSVD